MLNSSLPKPLNEYACFSFSSVTQSCPTLCDLMNCSTPGLPVHHQLLEFTQTHVHWVSDAIQPSLSSVVPFSSCPQSLPASVFSNESTLRIRLPKYWSFSLSISPSKEYPGLISFRMGCLDLLAVQGTLKSLYSVIKKNTFESVLMRWMKLEPIIQSKVSQKEKHQYSILMHIYGI